MRVVRPRHIEKVPAVRKKVRIVVADFLLRRIQLCRRHCLTARRRHPKQRLPELSADQHHALRAPRGFALGFIADDLHGTAGGANALDLVLREKADVPAVARPEQRMRALGALQHHRRRRIERPHPYGRLAAGARDEGERPPVGGEEFVLHAAGETGAFRRHDIETHGARIGRRRPHVPRDGRGGDEHSRERERQPQIPATKRRRRRRRHCRCGRRRLRSLDQQPQIGRVAQPVLLILLETPAQQLADARARGGRKRAPVRFQPDNRAENLGDIVAVEGAAARQHFVEHAAEREDVGAPVDRPALRLFGRHVRRGSEDQSRHRRR